MRSVAAAVLVFAFLVIASPRSGAATFDITLSYMGAVTGTGQFSFDDSLIGQTIIASEVTSFRLNLHDDLNGDGFGFGVTHYLGVASQPPPPYDEFSAAGFPYFKFDSSSDTFIPYDLSALTATPSALILKGGMPDSLGSGFLVFNLIASEPVSTIYTELYGANTINFGHGFYDQIVVTAVPEPSSVSLTLLGLGLTAAITLAGRGRRNLG